MPDDVTCQDTSADCPRLSVGSVSPERNMFDGILPPGMDLVLGARAATHQDSGTSYSEDMQKFCRSCSRKCDPVQLQLCQINFEEAIFLCVREDCQFPLLEPDINDFIVKRNITQLAKVLKKQSKTHHKQSPYRQKPRDALSKKPETKPEILEPTTPPFVSPHAVLQMLNLVPDDILQENIVSEDVSSEESAPPTQPALIATPASPAVKEIIGLPSSEEIVLEKTTPTDEGQDTSESQPEVIQQPVTAPDVDLNDLVEEALDKKNNEIPELSLNDGERSREDSNIVKDDSSASESNDEPTLPIDNAVDGSSETISPPDLQASPDLLPEEKEEDPLMFLMKTSADPVGPPATGAQMLQFYNSRNSCWLDVLLQCLVNVPNVRLALNKASPDEADRCCFLRLCRLYDSCQQQLSDGMAVQDLEKTMDKARNGILSFLVSRFQLKPGSHEGAAEMFRNIMKLNKMLSSCFTVTLRWEFECESCEHKNIQRVRSELVSFLSHTTNFHPLSATSVKSCSSCGEENQQLTMTMEKVPMCVMMHFQQGLSHNRLTTLDFGLEGNLYTVCAVIQYINQPFNHFILWIKDCKANKWMCCDDLQKSPCSWQKKAPKIPPKQIHMVMWEKQGALPSYFLQDPPPEGAAVFMDNVVNFDAALSDDENVPDDEKMETIVVEDGDEDFNMPSNNSDVEQTSPKQETNPEINESKVTANRPIETSSCSQKDSVCLPSIEDGGLSNIVLSDSDSLDELEIPCIRPGKRIAVALSSSSSESSNSQPQTPDGAVLETKDETHLDTDTSRTAVLKSMPFPGTCSSIHPGKSIALQPVVRLEDIMKASTPPRCTIRGLKRKQNYDFDSSDDELLKPTPKQTKFCTDDAASQTVDSGLHKKPSTVVVSKKTTSDDDDEVVFVSEQPAIKNHAKVALKKDFVRSTKVAQSPKVKSSTAVSQKEAKQNKVLTEDAAMSVPAGEQSNQAKSASENSGGETDNSTSSKTQKQKWLNSFVSVQSEISSAASDVEGNSLPSMKARSKERRKSRSQSTKDRNATVSAPKPQERHPNETVTQLAPLSPPTQQQDSPKPKIEQKIEKPLSLENKLESIPAYVPEEIKPVSQFNSHSGEMGGLAVVRTSPSAFPAQPAFVYRPAVATASTPPLRGTNSTPLSSVGNTGTTDFRKLSNTKLGKKSKLLTAAGKFESYTPKRFRIVGYEKKSLKQSDASNQSPYRSNHSSLHGNRTASYDSSDKSSEVSDLTDTLPTFDGASTVSSWSTKSSNTSRDPSTYGGNISQRTSPFTVSCSPASSTATSDFSNTLIPQDHTTLPADDSQDTSVIDDLLNGLDPNYGVVGSVKPQYNSNVPGDEEGLDLSYLLDFS